MLDRTPASTLHRPDAVTPVSGADLNVSRGGRTLLDVSEIAFGDPGISAIIGPNGAGKSMLVKCLAGLFAPDRGNVLWNGEPPSRERYLKFGMLLQHPVLLRRSALANVVYALRHQGLDRLAAEHAGRQALRDADLETVARTSARLLSGGEKQRLAMARAMALAPEILFLDEPTASLDPASTLRLETMIAAARDDGVCVVLITHDMAQARRLADTVILMHAGRIIERAPSKRFFDNPATEEARAFASGEILI